jgi:Fusaric acid resistance protein-like
MREAVIVSTARTPIGKAYLIASAGSLPVGPVQPGRSLADQLRSLALALAPTIAAAVTAALLAGTDGIGKVVTVLLATAAALLGGYGRMAAVVTTRFTLFLIVTQSLAATMPQRLILILLLSAGAIWAALLWLAFGAAIRMVLGRRAAQVEETQASASISAKSAQWRAALLRPAGWQFAVKLGSCLAIAEALGALYPDHHLHWIALTIVILAQRRTDPLPVKVTQRALGAALGVIVAGLCLAVRPPIWLLVSCIGLIAGTRPLLKTRHYLSYTAMMTTLIVLMMEFDQPPEASVLADRVLATFAGAAIVIAANLIGTRISVGLAALNRRRSDAASRGPLSRGMTVAAHHKQQDDRTNAEQDGNRNQSSRL